MSTDRTFTGQKSDGTGLLYYNARYYDPALGMFLSPDTVVPDASAVIDYNRFMYARGNPLKYADPSGHCATTKNGKPDMENDGECWQMANSIAGLGYTEQGFHVDWGDETTPDWWLSNIANQSFATVEYLTPFYERYQNEFEGRTGLRPPVSLEPVVNPEVHLPGQGVVKTVGRDAYACTHSVADCGKALDDASTALSAAAMGCAFASFAYSGPAATLSTVTGVAGTALSGINALVGNGKASAGDVGYSLTTTVLGGMRESARANRSVGFGISLLQWLWSHQEDK